MRGEVIDRCAFLVRETFKAFQDLELPVAQDYDYLNEEILNRTGLTKFSLAQRIHDWSFQNGLYPLSQIHELAKTTSKGLEPEVQQPLWRSW